MRWLSLILVGLTTSFPVLCFGNTLQAREAVTTDEPVPPIVRLDRLDFPKDIVDASRFEKHLRKVLKREAYRADWGAGAKNHIEYRFIVNELSYRIDGQALRIRCEAQGRLPGGQTAKSELSYGGNIGERIKLTQQVLEIVGRGVITRLAELERRRRGLN